MRVLVLVNVFAPDRGGAAAVYSEMCYELARRFGMQVTVCAPYPFFPEWRDKSGRNGFAVWKYNENGVDVRRYGLYIPKNPSRLIPRLVCEVSILLSMIRAVPLMRQADAAVVYCPHASLLLIGWIMKKLYRKPAWLNVQDFVGDAAVATEMSRNPFAAWILGMLRKAEKGLIRSYDLHSTISETMVEKLKDVCGRDRPVRLIPNWADSAILEALAETPVPADVELRRRAQPTKVHLLYAGNVSRKQCLLAFCRHLASSDADFSFRIYAAGGCAQEVADWIAASGDARFEFGPFLDASAYARELKSADFYVITERDNIGSSFFPSKAVVGMASGLPIMGVCDPESPLGRELVEHPVGPRFDWDRLDEVVSLIRELNRGVGIDRLARWANAALLRAGDFDKSAITSEINEMMAGLVASTRHDAPPHREQVARSLRAPS